MISFPYIRISRIEFVKDHDSDYFAAVTDPWEIWECISELKRNYLDLVQVLYDDAEQGFVMVVHLKD